jgi:hypothetical protein
VAIGTALPNPATQLIFWPWYIRHVYGIEPASYAFSTWIRPGIAVAPFALCTYIVEKWWPATNLFVFLVQTVFLLPIALAVFWFLCIDRHERERYHQKLLIPVSWVYARLQA